MRNNWTSKGLQRLWNDMLWHLLEPILSS
jgi:hypothetical protein